MLSIKSVSSLTGVNPVTLRAWERRYGLIEPQRTESGHRAYSHDDVARIQRVLSLTRDGVAISRVKEVLEADPVHDTSGGRGPWPGYRRRFAAAIAAFDEESLEQTYNEALALHPMDLVDRMVLLPTLEDLGRRWNKAVGGVAEEHFFSAYVRNKIGARFHHRRPLGDGDKLLVACGPGEQHEVGLLLFALAAHAAGFRVVLLGANVPFGEMAAAARRSQCDAVVIACAVGPVSSDFYAELAGLFKALRRPILVGGRESALDEQQVRAAGGVLLGASIESAVRLAGAEIRRARNSAQE